MGGADVRVKTQNLAYDRNPRLLAALGTTLILFCFALPAHGAPVFGEEFDLRQPDGTFVPVLIWGDEYYQVVESLDGYTLVRDPQTQVICYATLSPDKTELLSTGLRVYSVTNDVLTVEPHLRIKPEAARVQTFEARKEFILGERQTLAAYGVKTVTPPSTGDVEGICLIVDFPDEAGTIAASEIDDYCNQVGYTGFGNNGSIYDYFNAVSNGALRYTNYVPAVYYTAANIKSYYDNPTEAAGPKARELMAEALNWLETSGHDFSQNDANGDGYIDAINCFYAGVTSSGWAMGLWPHASSMTWSADGVTTYRYQVTGMGTSPSIGAFCHENGHMLLQWPDLYDYGGDSRGVGRFCIMCNNGSTNPQHPCAYLKLKAGWATATTLSTPQTGLSVTAESNSFYKLPHPALSNEYYLIENRQSANRDSILPDSGLAIWHIDESGDNDNQEMTPASHYEVTLVQADGRWDFENNVNYGDNGDLFDAASKDECGPLTSPHSNWWAGNESTFDVHSISANGTTMTFDFGAPADSGLRVTSGEDFDISGPEGGPFAPASKIYRLTNTNTSPIDWSADSVAAWLDFSSVSGSLSPGASVDITIALNSNADAMSAGEHTGLIVFSDVTNSVDYTRGALLTAYGASGMTWDAINSPQALNAPFSAHLSAVDKLGHVVTAYAGNAALTAQNVTDSIQVGTAFTTRSTPLKTTSHDVRMECIFLASEIGASGPVLSLSLYVAAAPGQKLENWTIRLQHTTQEEFPPYLFHGSGWTTVYQDDVELTAGAWNTCVFTAPFAYNGTDNLLIDFSFNNSSSSPTDGTVRFSSLQAGAFRSLYGYANSTLGDPLTWSGTVSASYTTHATPNILLDFGESLPVTPPTAPFTSGQWNDDVTVTQPGASVRLVATNAGMLTAVSNTFLMYDPGAPSVASATRASANPTNAASVDFALTFSENVTGVDISDFALTASGLTGANVSAVNGADDTYTVSVTTGSGDGTLRLDVIDDDSIISATDSTPLGGAGAGNGGFTLGETYAIDKTPPAVSVDFLTTNDTAPPLSGTVDDSAAAISVTVNGQTHPATNQGGGTWTLADDTLSPLADGTYDVMAEASDAAGNIGSDMSADELTIDATAPAVDISAPSASITTTGPVTYTVTYTGADAVTLSNGDVTLNSTGDATGIATVSGSDNVTRTVTINNISGNGALDISLAANTASDNASNSAPAAGPSEAFQVDNTAIAVHISPPSATIANTGPVSFIVTYENVTSVSLTSGSIALNSTGNANANVAVGPAVKAEQTLQYLVTLSSITGSGALGISIAAGTATDDLSNSVPAAGPSATFDVDNTHPSVDSIVLSTTKGLTASFDVAFTEPVSGVDLGDYVLTTTGAVSGASLINVTGTGAMYTLTVDTGSGNGTIRPDVTDDDSIVDYAGNALGGPGAGNGDFTAGDAYQMATVPIEWRWAIAAVLIVSLAMFASIRRRRSLNHPARNAPRR